MKIPPTVRSEVVGSRPSKGGGGQLCMAAANNASFRKLAPANYAAHKADTDHTRSLTLPNAPVSSTVRAVVNMNQVLKITIDVQDAQGW